MLSAEAVTCTFQGWKNHSRDNHENIQYANIFPNKTLDYLHNISYEDFFANYLSANKPCIIVLKEIEFWKSREHWAANEKPNFVFLEKEFGSSVVPVADCNIREYNSQKKKNMTFSEYVEYWRNLDIDKNIELLYLKDWHFKREYPQYEAYNTPEYFRSDWLNEFCENLDDDYQFVYMGPKGTWTPLHSDVFGSYSWSVNICGRKKWLLFPPGHENFLRDERRQVRYMVDENYLEENEIFYLKVIQEAGEIIFVPSGWYHQVWNLEDTISINHNWFNGCNIQHVWNCLYEAAIDVENEIADCKEFEGWEDQWQIILKAHHGMNYADFLRILQFIVKSRTEQIKLQTCTINWHFVFDLLSIKELCSRILSFKIPDSFRDSIKLLYSQVINFLSDIDTVKNLFLKDTLCL